MHPAPALGRRMQSRVVRATRTLPALVPSQVPGLDAKNLDFVGENAVGWIFFVKAYYASLETPDALYGLPVFLF